MKEGDQMSREFKDALAHYFDVVSDIESTSDVTSPIGQKVIDHAWLHVCNSRKQMVKESR